MRVAPTAPKRIDDPEISTVEKYRLHEPLPVARAFSAKSSVTCVPSTTPSPLRSASTQCDPVRSPVAPAVSGSTRESMRSTCVGFPWVITPLTWSVVKRICPSLVIVARDGVEMRLVDLARVVVKRERQRHLLPVRRYGCLRHHRRRRVLHGCVDQRDLRNRVRRQRYALAIGDGAGEGRRFPGRRACGVRTCTDGAKDDHEMR